MIILELIRPVIVIKEEKRNNLNTPCKISTYERKLLKELLSIFEPFEGATLMVQDEQQVLLYLLS